MSCLDLSSAGFVLIPCNVNVLHTCLQGKETSLTTTGEKDLDMETKLTDKNIDRAEQLCLRESTRAGHPSRAHPSKEIHPSQAPEPGTRVRKSSRAGHPSKEIHPSRAPE